MMNYLKEIIYLLGDSKKKLPMLFVFFLIMSLLDLIGVGLMYPFLSIVINSDGFNNEYLKIILVFLDLSEKEILVVFGLSLIFIFLIKSVVGVFLNWVIISFGQKQQIRLRTMLMGYYQNLSYGNYLTRNSSDFIYSIQSLTVQYSSGVITNLLQLASEVIVVISLFCFLVYTNGSVVLVVVSFFASLIVLYDRFLGVKNHIYGDGANKSAVKISQGVTEGMTGFKEIKLLNKESFFYNMVKKNSEIYAENNLKQTIISTSPRFLIEFVTIAIVILFVVSPLLMGGNILEIIPSLGVLGLAGMRLMPSMNRISGNLAKLRYNRNAVSRLYSEIEKIEKNSYVHKEGCIKNKDIFENMSLVNVSFKYKERPTYILKNISLSIKKGETVGFIGDSGSGKTTLVDIILGLLEPQSGGIYYNGKLAKKLLMQWGEQVAYLPQNIFLLDDSISKNITLEDEAVDVYRLNKALDDSKLTGLIESLSEGIHTTIGERGMQLSGGQRQRISLARALYHHREILVMDEATSALDLNTEQEIVEEINSLRGEKTILIIAHRLTTLKNCDKIFRLSNGVLESGTPEEMLIANLEG